MTDNIQKYMDDVLGLISDINPKEIASQIESDNLAQWSYIWRSEMRYKLSKLLKAVDDKIIKGGE